MLSALFMIVKIIGIILLVLLVVAVILLGLVLFVPIGYQVSGYRKLGDDAPVHVRLTVTWLLRIVRVLFVWPDAAYVRVKILFFTIFKTANKKVSPEDADIKGDKDNEDNKDKEKPPKEKKVRKNKRKEKPPKEDTPSKIERNKRREAKRNKKSAKGDQPADNQADEDKAKVFAALSKPDDETAAPLLLDTTAETAPGGAKAPNGKETPGGEEAFGDGYQPNGEGGTNPFVKIMTKIKETVRQVKDKIVGLFNKIRYTIREIYAKIKDIANNVAYYTEIVKGDLFRQVLRQVFHQLARVLRHIRPTKVKAHLQVGTGDPASTGQILELYSILYPFIGNNVVITPDFDQKIIEGEFLIKGRVTVIVLLAVAWTVYRDKNIRKLIKLLKREVS